MSEQKQEHKLVSVTLTKDHTHAGEKKKAGEKIKVTEPERDWLVAAQVITAPKDATK